jgi:hypothetical protein
MAVVRLYCQKVPSCYTHILDVTIPEDDAILPNILTDKIYSL